MDWFWIVITVIAALGLTYFIIYWAVLTALRDHSVWVLAGGAEKRHREEEADEAKRGRGTNP